MVVTTTKHDAGELVSSTFSSRYVRTSLARIVVLDSGEAFKIFRFLNRKCFTLENKKERLGFKKLTGDEVFWRKRWSINETVIGQLWGSSAV